MEKKLISAQDAKQKFLKCIYDNIVDILTGKRLPNFLEIQGSSIFVKMPTNFFANFIVPENLLIEIKFIVKKQ